MSTTFMTNVDVINKALQLCAVYSNGGVVVPAADNYDYILRGNVFVDQAQKEVATRAKIHASYKISQNPITPCNGADYGFTMKQFLPGKTGDLVDICGVNGRAYYFEVDAPCTVYVEESADNGTTWTFLSGVSPINITYYTEYKGLITPTLATNQVRLRFTGAYPFTRRNAAIWDVPFASATSIPTYHAWIPYQLPSDFMEFDKIVHETDARVYENMFDIRRESRNIFYVNYYYKGSFTIWYYKVPDDITPYVPTALGTPAVATLQVYPGMPQETIAYYVAAHFLMDEYPAFATNLMNEYQSRLANLSTRDMGGAVQTTYISSAW